MINVLIIDDEPNVRLGLKKMIDWQGYGFYVCDTASNAKEGHDKIMNLKPEIVLVDIKMPGKLGIDLIREVINEGFKGKFIILSGYSNFEYAKDAIKYGVRSYILKPVDEDELIEALLKIKKEIEKENILNNSQMIIEEDNLRKIILDYTVNCGGKYNKYDKFTFALISIVDRENKVSNYVKEYLLDIDSVDVTAIDQYIAVIFEDFKYERILKTLSNLSGKLKDENEFFAVVTRERDNINLIGDEYKKARKFMENKFLYLEKRIVVLNDKKYTEDREVDYKGMKKYISKVHSYVEIQDIEKLTEIMNRLKNDILEYECSEEKVKVLCIEILLDLRSKLFKDYDIDRNSTSSSEEIIRNIYSQKSLESTINYLINEFSIMSKMVSLGSKDNNIKRILSYMEKNYYKDLKLETLAEIFNYNSAYLGKLLKNSIGENFNTKLDKIRIEKAKSLLVNNKLKVYQVCEKVGYKNIDYFHSKFKKYVGTTPLNYKKSREKLEENLEL